MIIQKVTLILAVFLNFSSCDNAISFNTKRNIFSKKSNFSLKDKTSANLPKQNKFFDLNDFDCKYQF